MDYETYDWTVLADFFKKNGFVHHQIESFDDFINYGIERTMAEEPSITVPLKDREGEHRITFNDVYIPSPTVLEEDRSLRTIFPSEARVRDLTYDSPIYVTVTETIAEEGVEPVSTTHTRVVIGRIPIMLKSKKCSLSGLTPEEIVEKGECARDPGGYFIVKGKERVIIAQIRGNYNVPMVFSQKPKNGEKYEHVCEVRSMSEETGHSVLVQCMIGLDRRTLVFSLPYIKNPIPIGVVFKAFGYLKDEEIEDLIGLQGDNMKPYMALVLRDSFFADTQERALEHIGAHAKNPVSRPERAKYAWQVLEGELFPHMGVSSTVKEKAYFVGHIVHKLMSTHLKMREPDDRDNYVNKRIEPTGVLCSDLFRTLFKNYIESIAQVLTDRKQRPDILSVMARHNIITTGFRHCYATGKWGAQKNSYTRAGVSQVLCRLTYGATLSHLRRATIPIGKEGKNAKMRQIHPSQAMFLCPTETPEGAAVGIVLNFSLLTKISRRVPAVQVKSLVEAMESITLMDDFEGENDKTKVFVNGFLMGMTDDAYAFVDEFKEFRKNRMLPSDVSVGYDDIDDEIHIFSDEGRMTRPVYVVKDQAITASPAAGTDWDQLVEKGHITYVDNMEVNTAVVAFYRNELTKYRNDYCEISPSMMFGVMASTIPFPDHSQSPRNVYQCLDPETPVRMANGNLTKIKDIKIGDSVITVDPETCMVSTTNVVNQYVRPTDKIIVEVTTCSGRKITCTDDHPILTPSGWKQAKDVDSICVIPDDTDNTIISIKEYSKTVSYLSSVGAKPPTFFEWMKMVEVNYPAIFVPVYSIKKISSGGMIADITTESENHSFIAGDSLCVHNSAMGKQAMGMFCTAYNIRTDTVVHVLDYPQRPLVTTKAATLMGFDEMPSGINAVVAVLAYSGFNQEDSVLIKKSAIERGMFSATTYRNFTDCEKKQGTHSYEKIILPGLDHRRKNLNYGLLDTQGIVRKSVYVEKGDVIIAKSLIESNKSGDEEITDCSMSIKKGEEGFVERRVISTTPDGYRLVKIIIRTSRIPEVGDKFACYSPDTEVLTKSGWKWITDMTLDDEVACLQDRKRLEYIKPTEVQSYDFSTEGGDGQMYNVDTSKVDLMVTPNHRMYTGNVHRKSYCIQKAEDIYGQARSYSNNVEEWEGERKKTFTLHGYGDGEYKEDIEIDLEAWCLFLGIWMAEGSCSITLLSTGGINTRKVSIAANKQRVRDQLEICMEKLPFKCNLHMSKGELVAWYTNDHRLIYYLKPLSVGAINKSLPEWCFDLDMYHSRKLIDGMVLGDGCYMGGTTTVRYYTSSLKLRDDFQQLCLHAGWGCNYYLKSPKGTQSKCLGKTITTNADYWSLTICKTQIRPLVNKYKSSQGKQQDSWKNYEGKVYCCSVPTVDGLIFVRRNGKSVWSGNTRSAQKGTCGLIIPEEDMPFNCEGITPDIILNPHALPSRMTVNQLLECIMSKTGAVTGKFGDATPFSSSSSVEETEDGRIIPVVDKLCTALKNAGHQPQGLELLYNGMTGEPLEALVFIGPTYYQRLKHLVSDKIHARAQGPVTTLTKQPLEGSHPLCQQDIHFSYVLEEQSGNMLNKEQPQWYLIVLLVRAHGQNYRIRESP
jgi:DNA-directed RNA polymerase beta subunit